MFCLKTVFILLEIQGNGHSNIWIFFSAYTSAIETLISTNIHVLQLGPPQTRAFAILSYGDKIIHYFWWVNLNVLHVPGIKHPVGGNELTMQFLFSGQLKDGQKKIKGKFDIPNLSEENDPEEIDVR